MIPPEVSAELREALTRAGLDSVNGAFAFAGGDDLSKSGLGHRRRTHVTLADASGKTHDLYLKRYQPEPLNWRLRRAWTYGRGKSAAMVEADNITAAAAAGIATMRTVAVGQDDAGHSYIVVTAVPGDALSRTLEDFALHHEQDGQMDTLCDGLADLAAKLHASGHVHRDFYAAHIFLHETPAGLRLYLIDLARVFRPRWRRRWTIKDLAQFKYSMPDWWVEKHWDSFLRRYLLKTCLSCHGDAVGRMFHGRNVAIACKVNAMRAHAVRRAARQESGA